MSPLDVPVIKHFNSSYYNLSGSADLYSKLGSSPALSGSNLATSPRLRMNPFGEPSGAQRQGSNVSSVSGSSKDLSDTSSGDDYNTCMEESRLEESFRENTIVGDENKQGATEKGNLFEGLIISPSNLTLNLSANPDNELESLSDYDTPAPALTPSSVFTSPHLELDNPAPSGEERGDFASTLEVSGEFSEATEAIEEAVSTLEVPGEYADATEAIEEIVISEKEMMTSSRDVDSVESDSAELGVETFVVDRPDYDDIIFAGGTSPEVGEACPGSSVEVSSTDLISQNYNNPHKSDKEGPSNPSNSGYKTKSSPGPAETPDFISNSPMLARTRSPLLSDDSPVLARENPVLARESPALVRDSPLSATDISVLAGDSPRLARSRDSPVFARDSPVSPGSDRIVTTDSPVSPGLTDQTSSGDEVRCTFIYLIR